MLSDYQIALLLQQQYDEAQGVFDVTVDVSGVYCSVKHFEDYSLVIFRGSSIPLDFWRDFQGLMITDANLGGVEQGFITGLRDVKAHFDSIIPPGKPIVVAGHSLGAARAFLFAGLWLVGGGVVNQVTVFGAPRPGGERLRSILGAVPTIHSYCNGEDPVCKVPFTVPYVEPYLEPVDFILINEPPKIDDPWGPFIGWHHLTPMYRDGVAKLCGTS